MVVVSIISWKKSKLFVQISKNYTEVKPMKVRIIPFSNFCDVGLKTIKSLLKDRTSWNSFLKKYVVINGLHWTVYSLKAFEMMNYHKST